MVYRNWVRSAKIATEGGDGNMILSGYARKLRNLIADGIRLIVSAPRKVRRSPSLAALMKPARGIIDSGVPDLASNPDHLAGFGRDGGRHH
jgi:hypothetical protein